MGAIIVFVCFTILLAFASGLIFSEMRDSGDDYSIWCIAVLFGLGFGISLSIVAIREYYEKKEWSSVKYELKKKVITIEEDNTIALDTVYTFKRK